MPTDEARAKYAEGEGEHSSPDSLDGFRERRVSGFAPKPESGSALLACADDDGEPDPVVEGSEPTRVTPEELIETLREASRVDQPVSDAAITHTIGDTPVAGLRKQRTDEDDTLIFVLHEASGPRGAVIRWAVGLSTLTVLAGLVALSAQRRPLVRALHATERLQVAATPDPATPPASAVPDVERLVPTPIVQQLVEPVSAERELESDTASGSRQEPEEELDEQGERPGRDPSRRGKRALARGRRRLADHEYTAAALSFERAIEYNPDDLQGYLGLGEAHLGQSDWGAAVRAFRRAAELSPDDPAVRAGLARAEEQGGNAEEAAEASNQASEAEKPNLEVEQASP